MDSARDKNIDFYTLKKHQKSDKCGNIQRFWHVFTMVINCIIIHMTVHFYMYVSRYSRISPFCTRTVAKASGLDNRSPTIFLL